MSTNIDLKAAAPARRNNGRRRRRLLPQIGAVLLVALLVAGFWPKAAPVETVRVTTGRLRATVNEEGRTRIKQRYVVSAPVTGQLRRIPFKAGAEVKLGETVLAVIDPLAPTLLDARTRALAEARRDTASANYDKARKAHEFAASELERFKRLHEDNAISIQELEPVQWREAAAVKDEVAAASSLRQAEAELAEFAASVPSLSGAANNAPSPLNGERAGVRGENAFGRTNETNGSGNPTPHPQSLSPLRGEGSPRASVGVMAPAGGQVLRVFEESARVVTVGMPLLEIGDLADLEVLIEVLSKDGAAIVPGAKVELEQWGGGVTLEARVRLVEPSAFTKVSALGVEEQRVNVVADLVTPADQRRNLGDAFRVEARIITWETDQALKVASGALFRRGQQWSAFVVRDSKAQSVPVTVGRTSGAEVQIADGLKDGDELIVYPGDRIHNGQRVKPVQISGAK